MDSAVRKARAISAVLSPASVRSVSATRAGNGSAGWQQVKISRSRSSGISSTRLVRVAGQHGELAQLGRTCRVTAQPVDRPVARRRGEPGAGAARDAVARPVRQRGGERVLRTVLGQIPIPGQPDEGRDHLAPLVAIRRIDRRTDSSSGAVIPRQGGFRRRPSARRVAGGDLDRLVQVRALDDDESADEVLGLGERPVRDQRLTVADPDRRRVHHRSQPLRRRARRRVVPDPPPKPDAPDPPRAPRWSAIPISSSQISSTYFMRPRLPGRRPRCPGPHRVPSRRSSGVGRSGRCRPCRAAARCSCAARAPGTPR